MKNMINNREEIFPFFKNNKNVIFLDSALTSIKPKIVIDAIVDYYENISYSTFRSNNPFAHNLTQKFKEASYNIARFLNIEFNEIVYVAGATDGLNAVARTLIKGMSEKDEIILGTFEHASNFLPWKEYGKEKNIKFKYYKLNEKMQVDLKHLESLITKKTKVVSLSHVYNTLGSKNDLKAIKNVIKKKNEKCLLVVDGAQAVGHTKIDLKNDDVDFYVFSGHKVFASNGIGVVYVKSSLYKQIEPFNYGGGNNIDFDIDYVLYKNPPKSFFSGTLNYPGILSLSKAIEFLNKYNLDEIEKYCFELKEYAEKKLSELKNVKIVNKNIKSSILLFEVLNASAEDVSYGLGAKNILLRNGSSCVKVRNDLFDGQKTLRLSFHFYNTKEDIDIFLKEFIKGGDFINALFTRESNEDFCNK